MTRYEKKEFWDGWRRNFQNGNHIVLKSPRFPKVMETHGVIKLVVSALFPFVHWIAAFPSDLDLNVIEQVLWEETRWTARQNRLQQSLIHDLLSNPIRLLASPVSLVDMLQQLNQKDSQNTALLMQTSLNLPTALDCWGRWILDWQIHRCTKIWISIYVSAGFVEVLFLELLNNKTYFSVNDHTL